MSGSQIGGVIGGVIGFVYGGGNWQAGYAIGSAIGGAVDPTVIKGPSIGQAQKQTSQAGVPRPVVYGHPAPFAGNLIDGETKARKITVKTQQGKGGPVTTEEHFKLISCIRVCEGPIGGYIRIWRNGVIMLDRRTSFPPGWKGYGDKAKARMHAFAQKSALYLGGEDQMPDPSLEAIHGVGNTPYYRGTAYIVVHDDVTDMGGVAAQWMFEVAKAGTVFPSTSIVPAPSAYFPLDDASASGAAAELVYGRDGVYSAGVTPGPPLEWGMDASTRFNSINDYMLADYGTDEFVDLSSPPNVLSAAITFKVESATSGSVVRELLGYYGSEQFGYKMFELSLRGANKLAPSGRYTKGDNTDRGVDTSTDVLLNSVHRLCQVIKSDGSVWLYLDGEEVGHTTSGPGPSRNSQRLFSGGYLYPGSYGWIGCVSRLVVWDGVALTPEQVKADYHALELIPVPDSPDIFYDIRNRILVDDLVDTSTFEPDSVSLREVEESIATRCNVPIGKLDFSALTDYDVPGFLVAAQDPGSSTLDPLMKAFFHDLPEVDAKIVAVIRGGAVVGSITEDDMLDTGDDDPIVRPETIEFPAKVSIITQDPDADYSPIPGTSIRRTPDVSATSEIALQLAIPFRTDERQQIADKLHKVLWAQAEARMQCSLPEEFSIWVVSDCFTFDNRRWLITKADYANGEVKLEADYDRASNYTSTATGLVIEPPTPPDGTLLGPTIFRAMNLPSLRDSDNVPGVYLAAQGVFDGWSGCDVLLSTDGGATYSTVLRITQASIMGYLLEDEPSGGEPITVRLYDADDVLENVTADQILLGQNAAAILDSSDVAEIIGFQDAQQTSSGDWELSTITRAGKGTTESMHLEDERFVMLASVYFLPIDVGLAGETLIFRAVTIGTDVDANPTTSLVFDPPTFVIDGGIVT